jgi:transposase
MERTGDDWKPVFNILEGIFELLLLVNAQHVKAVPGRKTDVNDAAWLAELLQHGLLRASFIPPVAQRERRDLTRYRRTFMQERLTLINRVQKLSEDANSKVAVMSTRGTEVKPLSTFRQHRVAAFWSRRRGRSLAR